MTSCTNCGSAANAKTSPVAQRPAAPQGQAQQQSEVQVAISGPPEAVATTVKNLQLDSTGTSAKPQAAGVGSRLNTGA